MKAFVVRLNPDPRDGIPYSQYLSTRQHDKIHKSSPMNGFHECVNFLSEDGLIRGYLPPNHSTSMRDGEPFVLVSVTAKTPKAGSPQKEGFDQIVGIQVGCKYDGPSNGRGIPRGGVPRDSQGLDIHWHFSCMETLSFLLTNPVGDARKLVVEQDHGWGQRPTYELFDAKSTLRKLLKAIEKKLDGRDRVKFNRVKDYVEGHFEDDSPPTFHLQYDFEQQVDEALNEDLSKIKGDRYPLQYEVRSFQYARDPRVVAYALKKANGVCGDCGSQAPFVSGKDGRPYLEVHHIKMLKDGGPDTPDNVVALCPNCHRKRHFG